MGETKINITDFIPSGYKNRISREELRYKSGLMSDRVVRKAIEFAPDMGEIVVSEDGGYFIPSKDCIEDVYAFNHYICKMRSRINAEQEHINKLIELWNKE